MASARRRNFRLPPTPKDYDRQCRNKVRYTSRKIANGVRRVMIDSGRVAQPELLAAYRCKMCHGWHLGNDPRRAA